ncbi:MAG: hypothetical protein K9J13_06195 [Saprospiraceae bacterium]|nr:hypothetical protein [Saprospiraceae bacterium]
MRIVLIALSFVIGISIIFFFFIFYRIEYSTIESSDKENTLIGRVYLFQPINNGYYHVEINGNAIIKYRYKSGVYGRWDSDSSITLVSNELPVKFFRKSKDYNLKVIIINDRLDRLKEEGFRMLLPEY